jgi:hypothetical protein
MVDRGQNDHIGEKLGKRKLEYVHGRIIELPLAQYALKYRYADEGDEQRGCSIDPTGIREHVNDQTEKEAQHQNGCVVFPYGVKKNEPDVVQGVDIPQKVDVVQHNDL